MFGQTIQSAWFFDSSVHLEAVSRLLYLVDSHEPFGVVCGPDGSGRTRVLSKLREELQRIGTVVVSLNLAGMDEESVLWQLANCVGSIVRSGMKRYEVLLALRDELIGRGQCGVQTVIMLDDMHRTAGDMNPLLRLLMTLNSQCQGLLTVIVASDTHLPIETEEHVLVRVSLSVLDTAESSDFVRSLARRHFIGGSALDESAVRAVSEAAQGNAAGMARVCELLRVVHEASPETRITGDTVRAVLDELAPRAVA